MLLHLMRRVARVNLARAIMITTNRMQFERCQSGKVPPKMLRLQKQFQAKNDLPVFLKGGTNDKILYYSTLGLTGFGLLWVLFFLASLILK